MKEYNKAKYLILFTFFLFIPQVKANSIKNIDMDVFVEKNGDASVTETWKTTSNEGTEIYRGYATKSYSIEMEKMWNNIRTYRTNNFKRLD